MLSAWYFIFLFQQKTEYELLISDWSSDVCSSDLGGATNSTLRRGSDAILTGAAALAGVEARCVCADAAPARGAIAPAIDATARSVRREEERERAWWGKRGSDRVDMGGRRVINIRESKSRQTHRRQHANQY